MSILLPPMFHWSPHEHFMEIMQHGLKPYSHATSHNGYAYPYICLATSPSTGWGLSGDMEWGSEIEEWDLWQIRLEDGDEITIRGDFAPYISEVRVRNVIPPDRVWHVAVREMPAAIEVVAAKKTPKKRRKDGS